MRAIQLLTYILIFIYLVLPSTILILFREPELTSLLGNGIHIPLAALNVSILLIWKFGWRGFVPFFGVAIGLVKYRMDAYLWHPPVGTNLSSKVAVITGGNSGLGLATAKSLVQLGAHVVITCRSVSKCEQAAGEISALGRQSGGTVEKEILDLSSLQSSFELSARLGLKHPKIHYLFNNAGSTPTHNLTQDGLEDGFGSMHLGHMALTLGLLPSLRRGGKDSGTPSRVIMTCSEAGITPASLYMLQGIPAFDPGFMTGKGEGDLRGEITRGDGTLLGSFSSYARAKLCNILFSQELNRRCETHGWPVVAHSLHTGAVGTGSSSSALSDMFRAVPGIPSVVSWLLPMLWRNPQEGSRLLLYAALSTDPSMTNGGQYVNGICQPVMHDTSERMKSLRLADEIWSLRLWDVSMELLRQSPFRETIAGNPI